MTGVSNPNDCQARQHALQFLVQMLIHSTFSRTQAVNKQNFLKRYLSCPKENLIPREDDTDMGHKNSPFKSMSSFYICVRSPQCIETGRESFVFVSA